MARARNSGRLCRWKVDEVPWVGPSANSSLVVGAADPAVTGEEFQAMVTTDPAAALRVPGQRPEAVRKPGHLRRLAPLRSCSLPVPAQESAERVTSVDPTLLSLAGGVRLPRGA